MKVVFHDPTFSLQLLRTIDKTYYKAADIGECLSTAYRIKEGDFESWLIEWLKTAKRVHKYAEDCLRASNTVMIICTIKVTWQHSSFIWYLYWFKRGGEKPRGLSKTFFTI
jgi:hypothetical protein